MKTIESHRYNMLRKTNTKNIIELVMFDMRNGVLYKNNSNIDATFSISSFAAPALSDNR